MAIERKYVNVEEFEADEPSRISADDLHAGTHYIARVIYPPEVVDEFVITDDLVLMKIVKRLAGTTTFQFEYASIKESGFRVGVRSELLENDHISLDLGLLRVPVPEVGIRDIGYFLPAPPKPR